MEEYLRNHPNEIEEYIQTVFEEFAEDGDVGALLSSLRVISRVQGITAIAAAVGITPEELQKALSEHGEPKFGNINTIVRSLGYCLMPQKIETLELEQEAEQEKSSSFG